MRWLVQTPALTAWFADKPDVFIVVPAKVLSSPDDLLVPVQKPRTPWSTGAGLFPEAL